MIAQETLRVDEPLKHRLSSKLAGQSERIRFSDDPALASLCTCLGLEFEIGKPDYDRLSPFFGVEIAPGDENPWAKRILIQDHKIGLELRRIDGGAPTLRHPDFRFIIDPSSFNANGELDRIVIFPSDVASTYLKKGFELVIVRDWILTSSLNPDAATRVSYLFTNRWEIDNNIAATQIEMMVRRQLAFSGTHDIVDHLLGANVSRFGELSNLYVDAASTFSKVFVSSHAPTQRQLLLSYLIGVLLDDLAQPRWYGSIEHAHLVRMALVSLKRPAAFEGDDQTRDIPQSFHKLMEALRGPMDSEGRNIHLLYKMFERDVYFRNSPTPYLGDFS